MFTGCHDGRFDCPGAPVGVEGLEEAGDAGDVRARHGGARLGVEEDAAVVEGEAGRTRQAGERRQDANPRRSDVRLPHTHTHPVRTKMLGIVDVCI